MSNTPKTPADAGPDLQRAVRPLYYWHDGPNGDCFRVETDEAESDAPCPHCAPRYDQAALDAAVAAERERCAKKPLTAQQLDKLIEAHVGGSELEDGEYSAMVLFAAAVERAHGIGA